MYVTTLPCTRARMRRINFNHIRARAHMKYLRTVSVILNQMIHALFQRKSNQYYAMRVSTVQNHVAADPTCDSLNLYDLPAPLTRMSKCSEVAKEEISGDQVRVRRSARCQEALASLPPHFPQRHEQ